MSLKMKKPRIQYKWVWMVSLLLVSLLMASCGPSDTGLDTTTTPPVESASLPGKTETKPNPSKTPEATQTPVITFDPEALAGKTVYFAHPWLGDTAKAIESIVKKFSQTNPWKIRVEVTAYGGEVDLLTGLRNREESDPLIGLIAAHHNLISSSEDEFLIADLTNYFNDPVVGFSKEEQEDFVNVFFEPFSFDGQIKALPVAPQATVLFYNKTWGKELGFVEPPVNIDAFRAQACEATFYNWQDKDINVHGTGGWMINLDPAVLASWYMAFGGQIPWESTPSFNNPAGKDAFSYLWDIKNQGCIWFALQPDPYVYFADRYTLLYAGTLDQVSRQTQWMNTTGSQDEWEVIGFPGVNGDVIAVDGPGLIITAENKEDQLAAWLFAKHLLEPEIQAKLVVSMLTLPVRYSTLDMVDKVKKDYPQWGQGAALLDSVLALPASNAWGLSQWVLQDAMLQLLQAEAERVPVIMEAMDAMIVDLVGETSP